MKLPQINYGAVQSLGRDDPSQAAKAAGSKYEVAGAVGEFAYKVGGHFELLAEQKEMKGKANQDITTTDNLKAITSQNKININDAFVPDSVRDEVIKEIGATGRGEEFSQGKNGYLVDTDLVAARLTEHYAKELQTGKDKIRGGRRKRLYGEYGEKSLKKNMSDITANINSANVAAGKKQVLIRYQKLVDEGHMEDARAELQEGFDMGYMTDKEIEKVNETGNKVALARADEVLTDIRDDAGDFKRRGDEVQTQLAVEDYNGETKEMLGAGIIDETQANERTTLLNQTLERQEVMGDIDRAWDDGGIEAAQAIVDDLVGNSTANFGADKWDSEMIKFQAHVNRKRKAESSAETHTSKKFEAVTDAVYMSTVMSGRGGAVVGKSSEKSIDRSYGVLSKEWMAQGQDVWENNTAQLLKNGKYTPAGLVEDLGKMAMSSNAKDPHGLYEAAKMYNIMGDIDPRLQEAFKKGSIKTRIAYAASMQGTIQDPFRIFDTVSQVIDDNKAETIQRRESEYTAENKGFNKRLEDVAAKNWGNNWPSFIKANPSVGSHLETEYARLENLYYKQTGDWEFSENQAGKDLKAGWGVSYINTPDGEIMQMPPDMQGDFVADQFSEYIEEDHHEMFTKYGAEAFGISSGPYNFVNGEPVYAVMYQPDPDNPYHKLPLLDEKNRFIDWKPDYNKTEDAAITAHEQAIMFTEQKNIDGLLRQYDHEYKNAYGDELPDSGNDWVRRTADIQTMNKRKRKIVKRLIDEQIQNNEIFAPIKAQRGSRGGTGQQRKTVEDYQDMAFKTAERLLDEYERQAAKKIHLDSQLAKERYTKPKPKKTFSRKGGGK